MSLAALLPIARAQASVQQESTFQDDKLLVYASPARQAATLEELRSLGVDRVRVSVFWSVVAPSPRSTTKPNFDASNPGAYPDGSFDRYDTLLELAQRRGIAVNFDVTSPAPYWATGHPPRADIEKNYYPSAQEFGRFVTALGMRYNGSYVPPQGHLAPDVPANTALPRVNYWSIWNEPNQPGWLNPQYSGCPQRCEPAAPALYRSLLDAAYAGLQATGHTPASDTIVIGETAPKGDNAHGLTRAIKPLPFLGDLYCLDSRYRPLSGAAARAIGCPSSANRQAFVAANPGLFAATGWGHHPYELTFAPSLPPPDRDFVTIANLPVLTQALARTMSAYRFNRPLGLPLYLTEFGYLTDPPSPLGVTPAQQATYINEAEFTAYNNPNVRTMSQFLLVDDTPKAGVTNPVAAFGGTFQTGLELLSGQHKPSFDAYRVPIDVPNPSTSRRGTVRVWGEARAALRNPGSTIRIQFARRKSVRWRTLRTLALNGTRYFDTRVRVPARGSIRLAWSAPPGAGATAVYSRTVAISVR